MPRTSPVKAIEDATALSDNEPEKDLASYVIRTIGPRTAAACLGLASDAPLWDLSDEKIDALPDEIPVRRLHLLYIMTHSVSAILGDASAALFLRSSCPALGNIAPLTVLAESHPGVEDAQLLGATRAFLEG